MASEFISSMKILLEQLQQGEKNASDVMKNFNIWAREIGDLIKDKVEDEVERSVKRMGFVKKDEYKALEVRVQKLEAALNKRAVRANAKVKSAAGKVSPKKKTAPRTQVSTKKVSARTVRRKAVSR